ncbi:Piezo-type mechanosensitive ion channel-like [Citrus sinensis]|uniref:Piezo-type mechanosensitive ion channel-like n=1 Tax=Citrus sinensis TaxID=2711 RepID=A0ACB8MJT4_CITSI|nr:Piezo-type mechanosensitive ion channel-like [Citrus sinensis]KAH9786046.1 Piezo-type mechanosensitive ion channel-like [Citrus sinensis]
MQDMEIWEMVGLWHYPIPGFFLLAQFCLGVLVALGNLVNNSVFVYLSGEDGRSSSETSTVEVREETKVLIVATIAWGLRKCSRAIMLALIGLLAMKPGFIHAIYMIFFLIYLLSHNVSRKIRESLILLCEAHFALLYLLRIDLISNALRQKDSLSMEILSQLGLLNHDSSWDFLEIALLACFCAIHNHGFQTLFSFSAIVQHTSSPPVGFSILKAGLNKSVLLSVYSASTAKYSHDNSSYEASLLENVWESIAVLIVMQLYSYERRQSRHYRQDDPNLLDSGLLGFIKRFLVCHSQKILFLAVFYASLSPISALGLVYLLGLVICSTLPKASRIPSKSFLVYTGFLVTIEYLFQMWGKQAGMFPGQKHSDLSLFLGLRVYEPSFWGIELGLRGKVMVIVACTLQYNIFRWLEKTPSSSLNKGKWEEPCPLFVSSEDAFINGPHPNEEDKLLSDSGTRSMKREVAASNSWPSFTSVLTQTPNSVSSKRGESEASSTRKFSFGYFWGGAKESHKWNKKRILTLRKERFETQKTLLKIYLKFWMENLFNLFGLEINMIVLLLASFALLNAISLLYTALLAACVLLNWHFIRKLWPMFVFLFATILILEYLALWKNMSLNQHNPSENNVRCHDCSRSSAQHFQYCGNCWLGLVVDDPRTLISYFAVFMLACFKLRADLLSSFSGSSTYRQMMSQRKNTFVLRDLSFETKSMWTFLDYLKLYCYCHLLDLVLVLILITGTLEYDILHLGYLAFALTFFRMRLEILKKKNKIFKFLRIYNFVLIILSLAYQSPFVGEFSAGKCETIDYIFEMIGFYKYDYGFRITARSALVEIIIFMLVSLQSYMFSSQEFDYVSRYLEAEQIGAVVCEQERKAAWKTAQLQHIRESEEKIRQRNMQVEKMKSEMLNLQTQLHSMNSIANCNTTSPDTEGLRRRNTPLTSNWESRTPDKGEGLIRKQEQIIKEELQFPLEVHEFPAVVHMDNLMGVVSPKDSVGSPPCEINEIELDVADSADFDSNRSIKAKENPLKSAVQLLGDGVSQVQSIGNQAVNNLVSFLNITPEDSDMNELSSAEDEAYDEMESQKKRYVSLDRSYSLQSDKSSDATSLQIGRIFRYIWSQMRSNNDVVCYCCFVLVFIWNFSLLSMVYLAALFLYALCVHTGPSSIFWIIMLIYTEMYILVQYLYQIIIQHCGLSIDSDLLQALGFPDPAHKITSSFVVNAVPLFLVYFFTLLQSSITAKDSEWMPSTDFISRRRDALYRKEVLVNYSWSKKAQELLQQMINMVKLIIRRFFRYWKSLTRGAESPPYFVQLSMDVNLWPEDGIQPEKIESGINQVLKIVHDERCKEKNPSDCPFASRVNIQSIERSQEKPNIALVVLEVVYASPLTGCASAEWYKSLTPAADVAKEIRKAQSLGLFEQLRFPYPLLSIIGGGKREIDLYAYIFGADLTVFFLVAIFYQSIIKHNSELLDVYQLEDQFPKEFVFILMIIFFLIVLDRIIYLCSFAVGKVIFYLFNLILFTYSVIEYAWNMEASHQRAGEFALRAIFLAKAVSLSLQAIQIRYGIPHKSTLYRQFLTSEVSRINYFGYRLYRALPFLYELRCVLDWSCTSTSLTMYDWLKMYSSGNPTNIANPIKDASVQIDINTRGGKLTLYHTTLCEKIPWDVLDSDVNLGQGFLETYNTHDIQLICCQPDASVLWLVPGLVQTRFIHSLGWHMGMDIRFTWVLTRDRPKGKEVVKYENHVDPLDLPKPSDVISVLNGSTNSFRVKNIYPRYFRVTASGDVRPFEQEVYAVSADLVMNRADSEWWSFHNINASDIKGCEGLSGPMAIIVSEETPPQGILGDTLSKFSIWGLYITFVLAVGRFIRLQCSDLRMRIPFENLPSCDRLIAICEDIYSARAEGEHEVEEVLYWTLVKIYRSPHMLLEFTKPD